MSVDYERLLHLAKELLYAIGEDPEREGLKDTPRRWASWWREFIEYDIGTVDTAFSQIEDGQMVLVSGMRVYSLCEHHLLPFWCDVSIAYIPRDRVLGLSKFARVAQKHAHRLQLQERLVSNIADELQELTGTQHVAVAASGEHLCMTMRGIRTPAVITSTVRRGAFLEDVVFDRFLWLTSQQLHNLDTYYDKKT